MIIGRGYWILIWYGILGVGVIGLLAAAYWGRQTKWKNLDEILRAIGTITVSLGMLLLLYREGGGTAQVLMLASLLSFVMAFVIGRRPEPKPPSDDPPNDSPSPP